MGIEVELFGQLLPEVQRCQVLPMEGHLIVMDMAHTLGLNPEEVGLITIDGVQSGMEDLLHPGCRLCFFPHMSGG